MKRILFALCCLSILFLSSCEDDAGSLGIGTMPDSDGVAFRVDTFLLNTETVISGGVLFNHSTFIIGQYEDEKFGNVSASLLAQVTYPQRDLTFPEGARAESMRLIVHYSSFLNNNEIAFNVYEMDGLLNFREIYYTDIDVNNYTDFNAILGSITLTGEDFSNATDSIAARRMPFFEIDLGAAFAERFMDSEIYVNESTFLDFFNGINITPIGTGKNMLSVDSINLHLTYSFGEDQTATLRFPANIEVRQVNHLSHSLLEERLSEKPNDREFIFAPAGFFTKIDIPVRSIIENMNPDKVISLNMARITLNADRPGAIPLPNNLLLVRQSDAREFFERSRLPNNRDSFFASLRADTINHIYTYTFDLTLAIQDLINNNSTDEVIEMILIPTTPSFSGGAMRFMRNSNTLSGLSFNNQYHSTLPLNLTVIYNEFFRIEE